MLQRISTFGAIEDLGRGIRWEAPALAGEVARRAEALAAMGVGKGSLVAISQDASPGFFADLFAVWMRGAAAACLDSQFTEGERDALVRFALPTALLTSDGAAPGPAGPARPGEQAEERSPGDPALVLFTSGTTGAPKGVVLSHGALAARLSLNERAIGKPALARALVTLPTHFGHGLIGNALTPLVAGGDIVLPPAGLPLARELGCIVDDHRITFMSSVPALWPLSLKLGNAPSRRTLARVHIGSAPLSSAIWSDVAAWCGAETVNCYGMTETANWVSGASSLHDGVADGAVGLMWGGEAAVMQQDGSVAPSGSGEILIRTPALMSGYLDRPDLTRAALHEGWYRTGDLGHVGDDGRISLVGRLKDEINRAGFKIQPAELDALIARHPSVAETCAFAMPDTVAGEIVAAAVVLHPGAHETSESLRAWCRAHLRREAVPERWFIVDAIPRNTRGKVGRDAVRRMLTGSDR